MLQIIFIILALFVAWFLIKKTKRIKCGTINLITGGVKTGKSMLTVYLAYKDYKSRHRKWKFAVWRINRKNKKCMKKGKKLCPIPEEPLFYSNTPLGFPCCEITKEIMMREKRPNYGSVVYFDEAALVTDSMDFKNTYRNECIDLFNKLFGHCTHGGALYYDTQNIADNHKGIKRNVAQYINITHTLKWLPFFVLMKTREQSYDEDGNTVNVNNGDIEDETKIVLVPKYIWKKYDRYCYSFLTDSKPRDFQPRTDKLGEPFKIMSYRDFLTIPEEYTK